MDLPMLAPRRLSFGAHFRRDYIPEMIKGDVYLLEAYRDGFEAGRWGRPCEAPYHLPPMLEQLVAEGKADRAMTVRIHQRIVLEWHVAYAEAFLRVRRTAWVRAMRAQDAENGLAA